MLESIEGVRIFCSHQREIAGEVCFMPPGESNSSQSTRTFAFLDNGSFEHFIDITFEDGGRYRGEAAKGDYSGYGIYESNEDEWKHIGAYRRNVSHGLGITQHANQTQSAGWYRNDMLDGFGYEIYEDGSEYAGYFADGERHGEGFYMYPDGYWLSGMFRNGEIEEGTEFSPDGTISGTYIAGDYCEGCRPSENNGQATDRNDESRKPALIGTGSGFSVNETQVVTAAHVVEDCASISVANQKGHVDATIVAIDGNNDLALLSLPQKTIYHAKIRLGRPLQKGEAIVSYGYPLYGQISSTATITRGYVNNLAGWGNDSRFLQFDAPTQPGNSGGPLLDSFGNVIGVTSHILGKKYLDEVGHLAQNVNFAVKAPILVGFLSANGASFSVDPSVDEIDPASIVSKAEHFTYLVKCLSGSDSSHDKSAQTSASRKSDGSSSSFLKKYIDILGMTQEAFELSEAYSLCAESRTCQSHRSIDLIEIRFDAGGDKHAIDIHKAQGVIVGWEMHVVPNRDRHSAEKVRQVRKMIETVIEGYRQYELNIEMFSREAISFSVFLSSAIETELSKPDDDSRR